MTKLTVGVVGATGATGLEVCRLLLRHPGVGKIIPFGRDQSSLATLNPRLPANLIVQPMTGLLHRDDLDAVFLCTPTGEAMRISERLMTVCRCIIDLSADHRFRSASELARWHGVQHPAPETLRVAKYGLTEMERDNLHGAPLVANPGCFAVTAELALIPLAHAGILTPGTRVSIFAVNGMTGAGSTPRVETSAVSAEGNLLSYGLNGHRHAPEIETAVMDHSGVSAQVDLSTAHGAFSRGIHLIASIPITRDEIPSREEVLEVFHDAYGRGREGERFVQVIAPERQGGLNFKDYALYPRVSSVTRTNNCQIGADVDPRTDSVKVVAVTDNLGKGAAGNAVQNMNVALGLPEGSGLECLE